MSDGDWRSGTLDRLRGLIPEADPQAVEERKWKKPSNPAGVPTWSHAGILFTGETYKDKVKLTFARGATLPARSGLSTARPRPGPPRAFDIREGDEIDGPAFKALVEAAVTENLARSQKA